MVTNRQMGAGLLPHPEKIEAILFSFYKNSNLRLSIKLRAGLVSFKEIEQVIPVLNQFPLTEVIFHPRIAKQLYKGEILYAAFEYALKKLSHRLVYNGDIFSASDFRTCQEKFPEINAWMLGRGVLMNPFLPSEIKGNFNTSIEKLEKLQEFHQCIFDLYSEKMDNEGNVLNKMKQFWIYFSYSFNEQKKCLKLIKKASSLTKYKDETGKIFRNYHIS